MVCGGSFSATAAPVVIPGLDSPNFEATQVEEVGYWRRQYRRYGYAVPYAYYPPAYGYYAPPPAYVYPPAYSYDAPPPVEGAYPAEDGEYGNGQPANGDYGDYPPENGY
jgi:hypothetical protein